MKATLLHHAGNIEEGATVDLGAKTGTNDERGPDDPGGASTASAPVYAITLMAVSGSVLATHTCSTPCRSQRSG